MQFKPASRFRRFASLVYDAFIVFSFLLLLTAVALIVNRGESLEPYRLIFLIYLVIGTGLMISWCWKKGQTLGMLAWKIHLVDHNHQRITWQHAFIRYLYAIVSLGLGCIGLLWCFWDKDRQMLHDKWAKTQIVTLVH